MSAFTVDGYRVLLFDCSADSLSITAAASETGETFRIERWQLSRIKPSTVEAAFRRESPHLKYRFAREEKGLLLTITAAMEYLPTIEETIAMDLVEGQSLQSVLRELQLQLRGLENQLEEISNREEVCVGHINGSTNSNQNFCLKVLQGSFLVEGSGIIVSTIDEYNEQAEIYSEINFKSDAQLLIIVYQNQLQKQRHCVPLVYNKSCGYETPFAFTKTIKVDKPGRIAVTFNVHQINTSNIVDSHVKITPASVLK